MLFLTFLGGFYRARWKRYSDHEVFSVLSQTGNARCAGVNLEGVDVAHQSLATTVKIAHCYMESSSPTPGKDGYRNAFLPNEDPAFKFWQ